MNVLGRGVPVVACGPRGSRRPASARVRSAFAPNIWGSAVSQPLVCRTLPVHVCALSAFPRIGPRRELKTALESYWSGKTDEQALRETAAGLRAANWARQQALGVTVIPSNDFSLYDQVLDTSVMVGAIPAGYGWNGGAVPLDDLFRHGARRAAARARRCCATAITAHGPVPAQEMTKWFDTNYHYMVPEFTARADASRSSRQAGRRISARPRRSAIRPGRCCSGR